jgi:uncharacterized Zn finger protein
MAESEKPIAEPKCPECGVRGLDQIVSRESVAESNAGDPWFNIVQCAACGHVYGVFAKHVFNRELRYMPTMPGFP